MLKTLIFYKHLLSTSMKASISKRGAFLMESSLMVINNLIFFSIWWIFFRQFDDIAGWNFHDMIVLIVVGTGSFGLNQILFGGVRTLSRVILDGDLDPLMTQPKNLLLHIAGLKSFSKGWGQLMTAAILIVLEGLWTIDTLPLLIIGMICGCLVYSSISIIAHSLPFWLGSVEGISKKYCDALYLFSLYPTNIYSGTIQVVMFTLIPAGIISYLPVQLIRNFSWLQLLILMASSLSFVGIAFFVFYSGLKRYESGSKFDVS